MKVLWIVNTLFPAPSKAMGLSAPVFGGWMYGLAEQISKVQGIELAVATTYFGAELKKMSIEGIDYFLLPLSPKTTYDSALEPFWVQVCDQFQPDVVHIHGTEFSHGLACMRSLPHLKYVVSIQGLVSIIARTYYAGIPVSDIFKSITLRDILRLDTIFNQKSKLIRRGKFEKEYIVRTKFVIGRTKWDYAQTKAINPSVIYHFCNEILRDSFYESFKWDITQKNNYTIFLSQASYPIKGLHQVLKAVFLLKNEFPEIKVKVAGDNITDANGLRKKLRLSGYGLYLRKIIKRYNLYKHITFTGSLSELEMRNEYLNAHIFISPSSIENSANSVGEAQLLGVPVIASYVGGIPDNIDSEVSGILYPFDEVEMLAENIRRVFNDADFAQRLSQNAIQTASLRHNKIINLEKIVSIYSIIND